MTTKIFYLLSFLVLSAVVTVFSLSPKFVLAEVDDRQMAPNGSFEDWPSIQTSTFVPKKWIVEKGTGVSRSTVALSDKYSLQLSASRVRTDFLFLLDGYTAENKPMKLTARIKPTNPSAVTKGRFEILDYKGFTFCEQQFVIPVGTTNWTKQVVNCPTSTYKIGVVINQHSSSPALYDNVFVTAL